MHFYIDFYIASKLLKCVINYSGDKFYEYTTVQQLIADEAINTVTDTQQIFVSCRW